MSIRSIVVLSAVGLGVVALLAGGCAGSASTHEAGSAAGAEAHVEPLQPRDLMRGLVVPQRDELVAALRAGPRDEEDWDTLRRNVALLREASRILMRDRPADDSVWNRAAGEMLHDGSGAMLTAIRDRDLEAARRSYEQMSQACTTCHRECTAGELPLGSTGR